MATTVQLLINGSLLDLGVLASGETPAPEESADGLIVLNQLISSWASLALPIFSLSPDTLTLTGPGTYTIGPAMTFNTPRPVKIESAAVVTATTNISKAVRVCSPEEWHAYLDKNATGNFAEILYYDHGYPTGNIYLAPKPSGGTLQMFSYKALTPFASLSTSIDLPEGYDRAMRAALALDLAPMFGRPVTPELARKGAEAMTAIQGLNQAILGRPNQVEPQIPQAA